MSDAPLHFLFGIHNHQPVGNFDGVVDDAVLRAYHPFLQAIAEAGSGLSLTVHCSGACSPPSRSARGRASICWGGSPPTGRWSS